jgi:hypothetical protein
MGSKPKKGEKANFLRIEINSTNVLYPVSSILHVFLSLERLHGHWTRKKV